MDKAQRKPLEQFFIRGNKLAVFGSFLYSPKSAEDLDFTLFTTKGKNAFPCAPEYSEEIRRFLVGQLGEFDLRLDFSGRDKYGERLPYDLSRLPKDDQRLDLCLLAGLVFPDDSFLREHYINIFGDNFLAEAWKRYAGHVQAFSAQEERLDKRHKDIVLLLSTTDKLVENNPALGRLVGTYRRRYNILGKQMDGGVINKTEYIKRASDLAPLFISRALSLI